MIFLESIFGENIFGINADGMRYRKTACHTFGIKNNRDG
jgi:hypothetical protein